MTPLAATRALHAPGFEVPKNYAVNRFTGMEKRGVLVRVETGRYRRPDTLGDGGGGEEDERVSKPA